MSGLAQTDDVSTILGQTNRLGLHSVSGFEYL